MDTTSFTGFGEYVSDRMHQTTESAGEAGRTEHEEHSGGLTFRRFFSIPNRDPLEMVEWDRRTATIPQ